MNSILYHLLMTDPYVVCIFIFIAIATLSLWLFKTRYIFFLCLAGAFSLAFMTETLTVGRLICFCVLILLFYLLNKQRPKLLTAGLFTLATLLSLGIIFGIFPPDKLLHTITSVQLSKNTPPLSLTLSINEAVVGLLPLALCIPLSRNRFTWNLVWKKTALITVLIILVFFSAGTFAHLLSWKPHTSSFAFSFLFANFFLVVIPQEAFFRGFLQRQFALFFHKPALKFSAIIFSSVIFSFIQLSFISDWHLLALGFSTSLMIGVLYYITSSIESVIFSHFVLNVIHFFLFT
ncbi:hypothetical protein COB21_02485 [Candidatus Aerophobetes bacterium]|uniref:CAAX prenyl protease 2/Lysostaphin resistance protein A-like domain-containing protein n=1 Tax=Aerophobetes bacterium TaxID=2030807 RepID=A0A2A4X5J0_UNCAE|nr:MAG: hypothetical protein COB21_02485 [Candidatus Aerophobetes bacterium]